MGNLLGAPVTDKETHSGKTNDGIQYAVSSMQGWRVHMEDAHIMEYKLYAEVVVHHDNNNNNNNNNKQQQQQQQSDESTINDNNDTTTAMMTTSSSSSSTCQQQQQNNNKNNNNNNKKKKIYLPGHSLYAVFDGHGGSYAAAYSGRNLCRVLSNQMKFIEYTQFERDRPHMEHTFTTSDERTQYIQNGLMLLQEALQDTFIELDREIALALKGMKVPNADMPYNDPNDQDHHHDDDNDDKHQAGGPDSNADGADEQQKKDDAMDGVTTATTANSHESVQSSASSTSSSSPADAALRLLEGEGDSGTTACVVVVTPEWVVCANAGDSRAVMSKLGNRAVPLSYDHKPDDEQEERRIRAAGGYVAGGRVEGDLAVSRGLGDFRFKQMNIVMAGSPNTTTTTTTTSSSSSSSSSSSDSGSGGSGKRRPSSSGSSSSNVAAYYAQTGTAGGGGGGKPCDQKVSPMPDIIVQNRNTLQDEFIIIACDGIWDVQTNYEAVKSVATLFNEGENNLGLICEEVCDQCLGLGSKDNMTILLVKFPAQRVADGGGGVLERRQRRDNIGDDREGNNNNNNNGASLTA